MTSHEQHSPVEFDLASYDPSKATELFQDRIMVAAESPAAMMENELMTLHDDAVWPFTNNVMNTTEPFLYGIEELNLEPLEVADEREERLVEAGRFIDTILRSHAWALPPEHQEIADRIYKSRDNYGYYKALKRLTDPTQYDSLVSREAVDQRWNAIQDTFYRQEVEQVVEPAVVDHHWLGIRSEYQAGQIMSDETNREAVSDEKIAGLTHHDSYKRAVEVFQAVGVIDGAAALWKNVLSADEKTKVTALKEQFHTHKKLLTDFDKTTSHKDPRFQAALKDYMDRFQEGKYADYGPGSSLEGYVSDVFSIVAVDRHLNVQRITTDSDYIRTGNAGLLETYVTDVSLALLMLDETVTQ